jgi:hypothetical protein
MPDPTKCEPQLTYENACPGIVCGWSVEQPCAADGGALGDAGESCESLCLAVPVYDGGAQTFACSLAPTADGRGVTAQCSALNGLCIGGRAPRGFTPRDARAASESAAYLARMAQLEAASVDAFHALAADLARLGAPKRLLAAVRAAARDEVRHARMVGSMAERFGGCRIPVTVPATSARSAEEIALENAEEGCVRETFGAAIAAVQAERADDPLVRRMMCIIAREELTHAALAWRVARWLDARLDAAARRRVRDARVGALRTLSSAIRDGQPREGALGLPDGRATRAVLGAMWRALATGELERAA